MKKMRSRKLLSLFILFTTTFVALAQEKQLDTLVKKFDQYRVHALQEKTYAHLDRSFYLTGETLWFKIYTVDGAFHKQIGVSKVAYVEILDKANFPVLQGKIELTNGMGNGSFFLPASLNSGNYNFRLYTGWMKNFNPEFYYDQMITIVNPFVAPEDQPVKAIKNYFLDFFPEGGNLVAGIQSKVAFKISDASGKGIHGQGFVLNEKGDTIVAFSPGKFGIGHFLFTPAEKEKYRAVMKDPQGVSSAHPFPEVNGSGYVMQLRDSAAFLQVSVTSKNTSGRNVFLFVHARQITAFAERQPIRNNRASFILNKKDLPEGISHFTLFNDAMQPMCERLYFTYPQKVLEIDVASSQKVYSFRKKVSISLLTKKGAGIASSANLSLSVYKIDSLSTVKPMGIYPYLWLASDLTGTLESPEYYFNNSADTEAMDNLMLTHGWRRFDWKEVFENRKAYAFLPEVNGHIIHGVVTKDQEKQQGVFTYLGSPGKIIRAYGAWSNEQGDVRFEIKDFYGPRKIILQTQTDSSQSLQVKIENPFSTLMNAEKMLLFRLNENTANDLLSRSMAMQVQDIYYYERFGDHFLKPTVDSMAFYGKADDTYYLDDYTRFPVMEEVMREYVPGVFVRKRKDGFHFIVVNAFGGVLQGDPMVLVDGVPVLRVNDVMKMDPLRVQKLEVVKRQYFLGQAVFSGIVSYSTYKGDLGGLDLDPRSISLNYEGLQLQREFYSPRYNNQNVNDRMPDQRYLLHWEPDIVTDEEGKQKVEFYTSDVPGQYRVVVEGLNDEGFAGTEVYTFSVMPSENQ